MSLPLKSDLLSQTQLHGHSVLGAKVKQLEGEDKITGWGEERVLKLLCFRAAVRAP